MTNHQKQTKKRTNTKEMSTHLISYSEKYYDDIYEYRHVTLPKDIASKVPSTRLLSEYEWRSLGIQMSRGWVHYGHHKPEPHILLFHRKHGQENPTTTETKSNVFMKETKVKRDPLLQKNGQLFGPPKPTF